MTLTTGVPVNVTFKDNVQLYLYPPGTTEGNGKLLHDATDLRVELALHGNQGCTLSFTLAYASIHFADVVADGRVYVEYIRCGRHEATFKVLNVARKRAAEGYTEEGAAEVTCEPVINELAKVVILPDLAAEEDHWEYTGYPDDAMKDLLRTQIVAASSYDDPQGNTRELTHWVVAADKSAHGTSNATIEGRGEYLLDKLDALSVQFDDIDYDACLTWVDGELKIEFDTYYPRRGADRSQTNTDDNAPVFFNGGDNSIVEESVHQDNSTEITAVYDRAMTMVKRDLTRLGTYGLRELIVDGKADGNSVVEKAMEEMLTRNQVRKGLDVSIRQINHFRYGQDYERGDRISYCSRYFGTDLAHDVVNQATLEYDAEGDEHLTLELGDPEEDLIDKMKNGGMPYFPDYLPSGEPTPAGSDWDTVVLPVAGTNINGTALTVPHGDHQHKFAIQVAAIAEAVPLAGVITFTSTDGTVTLTRPDANTINLAAYNPAALPWNIGADTEETKVYATDETNTIFFFSGDGIYIYRDPEHHFLQFRTVWARHGSSAPFSLAPATAGDDLHIYSAGDGLTFSVAAATGNTAWAAGAKLTLEGNQYTPPTAFPGTAGMALTSNLTGTLTWAAPAPAAHGIVSSLHTVTGGAALDVIGLSAANTLARLTPTTTGDASKLVATDASGNITASGYLRSGANIQMTDANTYLSRQAGLLLVATDQGVINFAPDSSLRYVMSAVGLYPATSNTYTLGTLTGPLRWSNVVSVLGNFSGDVIVGILQLGDAARWLGANATTLYVYSDGTETQIVNGSGVLKWESGNLYKFGGGGTCGLSTAIWANVYSVLGTFSGVVTAGGGYFTGKVELHGCDLEIHDS
jgi:hypothetical protein